MVFRLVDGGAGSAARLGVNQFESKLSVVGFGVAGQGLEVKVDRVSVERLRLREPASHANHSMLLLGTLQDGLQELFR
jgi:hypothetical protein